MNLIDKITLIVAVAMILLIMIVGMVAMYIFFFRGKKKVESEDDIDYIDFDRDDSLSYMQFDDIFSDMIICDNYTRFVAVIKCVGYDYHSARAVDKVNTRDGYISFMGTIKKRMRYRQYTKNIDLESTRKNYVAAHSRIEEELYLKTDEYNTILEQLESLVDSGVEDVERELMLVTEVEKLQKRINSLDWRRKNLAKQITYIDGLSRKSQPERVETYVFDWTYNAGDYSYDLSVSEIVKKAIEALSLQAHSFIRVLSTAGVRAYRVRTPELIGMERRNFNPNAADIYKLRDIQKSNVFDTVTSTNALNELDDEARTELELLDIINFSADEEAVEVMEEPYDIPELMYEGSAIELGIVKPEEVEEEVGKIPIDPLTLTELTELDEELDMEVTSEDLNREPIDEPLVKDVAEVVVGSGDSAKRYQKKVVEKQDVSEVNEDDSYQLMQGLVQMVIDSADSEGR